jgi:hypothetical protein
VSQASRRSKLEKQLAALEFEFRQDLAAALRRCQAGEIGLFGRHDLFEESRWLTLSAVGRDLTERGDRIADLRRDLGLPELELAGRFNAYRALRGANIPGDPKLDSQFLREIEDDLAVAWDAVKSGKR